MEWGKAIEKKNILFLTAYGLYICSMLLEITPFQDSFDRGLQLFRYGTYLLCLSCILKESRHNKKRLFLFAVLILLFLFQSFVGGGKELVFMTLILFALGSTSLEDAFKVQTVVQFLGMFLVFFLCAVGVFPDQTFFDHGQFRHAMGFNYATHPGEVFLGAVLGWLYIRKEKLTIWETGGIVGIFGILYYFTNSRTTILLGVALSIFVYLLKLYKKPMKNKVISFWIYQLAPVYMTCLSFGLQYVYNRNFGHPMMERLNGILNGRLNWARQSMGEYGIRPFGSNIAWVDNTVNLVRERYNFVDNAYIKLVLDYGWIIGLLFLAVWLFIMRNMIAEGNRYGCILVWAALVYAFMTPVMTSFVLNPLLLAAGGIFHGKAKVRQT